MSNTRTISDTKKSELDSTLRIQQQFSIDIACGLFTGAFCSGLFNPYDRALYLSVKCTRSFLSWKNFSSPYQGFSQAVIQRAFLGSVYYIVQGEMKSNLYPYLRNHLGTSESFAQFCIGISAGSVSGILTNSISAIKYHTWGQENRTFFSSVHEMWTLGSSRPFFKGTQATVARDVTFGCTYEILRSLMRNQLPKSNDKKNYKESYLDFVCNSAAAGLATITSGPFNYARTMQYATPPSESPPTIWKALNNVWQESKNQPQKFLGKMRFFQQRFRVGWGTARVAVGMAVGQEIFDVTRSKLTDLYSEQLKTHPKK